MLSQQQEDLPAAPPAVDAIYRCIITGTADLVKEKIFIAKKGVFCYNVPAAGFPGGHFFT